MLVIEAVGEDHRLLLILDDGNIHAHNTAVTNGDAVVQRNTFGDLIDHTQGDIGVAQGSIGLIEDLIHFVAELLSLIHQPHHLPDEDIALLIHEVIAHGGERQGLFGGDQITFGRKDLLCHYASPRISLSSAAPRSG